MLTCALHPLNYQVFTYEDSNMVLANRIMERGNGFTTHRRVAVSQLNEEILPSKKSRKKKTSKSTRKGISNVGGDSSTASNIHVSDFLSSLHQNANQSSSPRSKSSLVPLLAPARSSN